MTGRVESVNVAVVSTAAWTGRMGRSGMDKRPVDGPVAVAREGVAGDVVVDVEHHGGVDQAVYAYAVADLDFWSTELGTSLPPGGAGENLTLSGIDCSHAVVGERWQVGEPGTGPVLVVTAPRMPCRVFAGFHGVPDLIKRFTRARLPGAYLRVEQPGLVRAGDAVDVTERPGHGVTVAEVMAAKSGARELLPRIASVREQLSERDREWLDKIVAAARVRAGG